MLLPFSRFCERNAGRQAIFLATLCLCIFWVIVGATLLGDHGQEPPIPWGSSFYAAAGRISSVLLSLLWGWCLVKKEPFELARIIITATLLSLALCLAGGLVDRSLLLSPFAALCSLAIALPSLSSEAAVLWTKQSDSSATKSMRQQPEEVDRPAKARGLFVITRMAWGAVLGLFIGTSLVPADSTLQSPLVVIASIMLLASITGLAILLPETRENIVYLVGSCSVVVVCVLIMTVDPTHPASALRMLAVAGILLWCLLMMFQYPLNSIVAGASPYAFATTERAIPFACACFIAGGAKALTNGTVASAAANDLLEAILATMLLCLIATTVAFLITHVKRYFPQTATAPASLDRRSSVINTLERAFGLTNREAEVCYHLAQGYSKAYVSKLLYVSPLTIKTHTQSIYRKLGVRNSDELIERVRRLTETHNSTP